MAGCSTKRVLQLPITRRHEIPANRGRLIFERILLMLCQLKPCHTLGMLLKGDALQHSPGSPAPVLLVFLVCAAV